MPSEPTSTVLERALDECGRGSFTGLLRVRTLEGEAQIRFLSGIQDGVEFRSVEGDEALERLRDASEPLFEAVPTLPPLAQQGNGAVPLEGELGEVHAAQLMRFCEENSLTCALQIESGGETLTASYRLGELLSLDPDSEETARLADAHAGRYRFQLPRFELTANVPQARYSDPVEAAAKRAAAPPTAVAVPPRRAALPRPSPNGAPRRIPMPAGVSARRAAAPATTGATGATAADHGASLGADEEASAATTRRAPTEPPPEAAMEAFAAQPAASAEQAPADAPATTRRAPVEGEAILQATAPADEAAAAPVDEAPAAPTEEATAAPPDGATGAALETNGGAAAVPEAADSESPQAVVSDAPAPAVSDAPAPTAAAQPPDGEELEISASDSPQAAVGDAPAPADSESPQALVSDAPEPAISAPAEPVISDAPEPTSAPSSNMHNSLHDIMGEAARMSEAAGSLTQDSPLDVDSLAPASGHSTSASAGSSALGSDRPSALPVVDDDYRYSLRPRTRKRFWVALFLVLVGAGTAMAVQTGHLQLPAGMDPARLDWAQIEKLWK